MPNKRFLNISFANFPPWSCNLNGIPNFNLKSLYKWLTAFLTVLFLVGYAWVYLVIS